MILALLSLCLLLLSRSEAFQIASLPRPIRLGSSSALSESPVTFAGTGQRTVDMNVYNLDLEVIEAQWTANYVSKTTPERDAGVYLGASNDRELFVDILKVELPRRKGEGLGIVLQEIAGGRDDSLGITVVSDVVAGSVAAGSDIMPGDSISRIAVVRRQSTVVVGQQGLADTQDEASVRTECFGYDATVDAILSLPEQQADDESYLLTIKRLRRKPKISVVLQYPPSQGEKDETIELFAGENLRLGMLVRGVKLNDPLAKRFDTKTGGNCGAGGLCRTCAVTVLRGGELLSPQKTNEKQMLADNPRWRLACKSFVGYGMKEGEMVIKVNPRQWEN